MIAGIIGATGYAGAELVRILSGHPHIDTLSLASVSFEGERIEKVYPNFLGRISAVLEKADAVIAASDVVFAALPNGVGEPYAKAAVEKGIPFIDLSADFRFDADEATFTAWYGKPYVHPELRKFSVYGLPELNRKRIKELAGLSANAGRIDSAGPAAGAAGKPNPVIIGNPGCYPTASSLGAFPALAKGIAGQGVIIADAASGVTGGGRDPAASFHYPECADSVAPYKVGAHRHTPEISRNLAFMAARSESGNVSAQSIPPAPPLIFTPHLAPMNRGILSTIYIPLAEAWRPGGIAPGAPRPPSKEITAKTDEIRAAYADFYKDEPFVRVLPAGVIAATNRVRQSNFCDISVHLDPLGTTLIIVSAIDNMVKGAAGQAIQNMNVIFGFDETAGLNAVPALF